MTTFYVSMMQYVHPVVDYTVPPSYLQSLESLRPDTVMSYLRKSAPKVWQVECGEYMT